MLIVVQLSDFLALTNHLVIFSGSKTRGEGAGASKEKTCKWSIGFGGIDGYVMCLASWL